MKDVGRGERTNFGKGSDLFLTIEEALKRLLDSPWNQINQNLRKNKTPAPQIWRAGGQRDKIQWTTVISSTQSKIA